jgi:type VI secretion system protein ImpE
MKETTMNAHELFDAGKLNDAIAAALEDVKKAPTDTGKRGFLAELLCFAGDLERADKQLDALGHQDPQVMVGVSLFRQLIRAEQARQQFYTEGRLPEFLNQEVTPDLRRHLEAAVLVREGKTSDAVTLLSQGESERPKLTGTCNGQPFDEFRDLDDLTASFFEVLTSTGKYYWIPLNRVDSCEFTKPARPRDLLWRMAHMSVSGGPEGEVFLPVLYAGSHAKADDAIRLGRSTEWQGEPGSLVRGSGQRMYLAGGDGVSIMELETLTFASA